MRRNTVLGDFVHLVSSDLYFENLTEIADNGSMQGLIQVGLRHGDIILEPAGHRFPHRMNYSQYRVTFLYVVHNDSDGYQIVNLIQSLVLGRHLFINRIEVFRAPFYIGFYARLFQLLRDDIGNHFNFAHTLFALQIQLRGKVFIFFRIQILHRKVFQLRFDGRNT